MSADRYGYDGQSGYENGYGAPCAPCAEMMVCGGCERPSPCKQRRQIVVNSATGGAGPLPIIATLLAAPINVVSTAIDTQGMGNTNNLITFSCGISLPLGAAVTLNFQLQRVLDNGMPLMIGSTYTFSRAVAALESDSFSFQFFDANLPEGNYTYSVNLSTNSLVGVTPGTVISNATLSVMASVV